MHPVRKKHQQRYTRTLTIIRHDPPNLSPKRIQSYPIPKAESFSPSPPLSQHLPLQPSPNERRITIPTITANYHFLSSRTSSLNSGMQTLLTQSISVQTLGPLSSPTTDSLTTNPHSQTQIPLIPHFSSSLSSFSLFIDSLSLFVVSLITTPISHSLSSLFSLSSPIFHPHSSLHHSSPSHPSLPLLFILPPPHSQVSITPNLISHKKTF